MCVCRYQQAELQNGRWAMLAVAGILFPELLSSIGFSWPGGVGWMAMATAGKQAAGQLVAQESAQHSLCR
jgi:hypothetical protein